MYSGWILGRSRMEISVGRRDVPSSDASVADVGKRHEYTSMTASIDNSISHVGEQSPFVVARHAIMTRFVPRENFIVLTRPYGGRAHRVKSGSATVTESFTRGFSYARVVVAGLLPSLLDVY